MAEEETLPDVVDEDITDLVAHMRKCGFDASEIKLIEAVADPGVKCSTKKAYHEYLEGVGVDISYERVLKVWKDPNFQRCVDLLFSFEEGPAMRQIQKTMLSRAADPNDPHGVAAARLVYQSKGLLRHDDEGGSVGSVESMFSQLLLEYREGQASGKNTARRRRFTVIAEELPAEEEDDTDVVDASFEQLGDDGEPEA